MATVNEVQEFPIVAVPREIPQQQALTAPTPMRLIELAVQQGADVDKLEKLLQLQIQWEKNEARKAFVTAMNAFKANPPEINKNKKVAFKEVEYWHATLDHVVDAIATELSKHGISHRWRPEQADGKIRVTCILTHELGHSEETPLEAVPDNSGSKNSIQAVASTVTYLERYTLLAATGLAAKNADHDGVIADGGMGERAIEEFLETIQAATSVEELQARYTEAYKAAKSLEDRARMELFIKAKNARYRVIVNGK